MDSFVRSVPYVALVLKSTTRRNAIAVNREGVISNDQKHVLDSE